MEQESVKFLRTTSTARERPDCARTCKTGVQRDLHAQALGQPRQVKPPLNPAMSLELIEATLKEQAEALATAQRCHGQMTRLIKEYAQRNHNADYQDTTQPKGQSKMQKQDTTPTPAVQAAPSRLDHEVVAIR